MMLTSLKNELDLHDYHLQYNVLEKRKLQKKVHIMKELSSNETKNI